MNKEVIREEIFNELNIRPEYIISVDVSENQEVYLLRDETIDCELFLDFDNEVYQITVDRNVYDITRKDQG